MEAETQLMSSADDALDPVEAASSDGLSPGICPVCNKSKPNIYYHAKQTHAKHHWTLEQAKAIGSFACSCGTLVRNDGQGMAVHRAKSGCREDLSVKFEATNAVGVKSKAAVVKSAAKRPRSDSPLPLCPVCRKNKGTDVFQHAKMMHSGHHWTAQQAEAIGAFACACGAVIRNSKNALKMHRAHTGCRQGLADKVADDSARDGVKCPVCGDLVTNVYHHGRTQHKEHKWTLLEAMSIGAYACQCGKLVRDPVWGMAFHKQRSGCVLGLPEPAPPDVKTIDSTEFDLLANLSSPMADLISDRQIANKHSGCRSSDDLMNKP